MTYPEQVKSILLSDIADMAKHPEDFSNQPQKDFSRSRKINFEELLRLIVSMEGGSIKHELLKHFRYDTDTPSASAFCQQRGKLHPSTFPYLLRRFCSHFPFRQYKGEYRLMACDGSEFNIARNPNDPDTFFPPSGKSSRGFNMVHVVALFDLLNRIYPDAVIQPIRKKNEFRAVCELTDRLTADDGKIIVIADRGFDCFNFYAHATENGVYFLVRAKDARVGRLPGIEDFDARDEFDIPIDLILSRTTSVKKRQHPEKASQYKYICKTVAFDFIAPGVNDEYPMSLRVLKFKLKDGAHENVITNLPVSFTPKEIKHLYNLRWGIETSFRELKHAIGAVNFRSKKTEVISQELWSRLILYNFCATITAHVFIRQKNTKLIYQVNYSIAIKICHAFLRLPSGIPPPDVEILIGSNTLPIRPDRNYARRHRFRSPVSFNYRFS
jgi:hypothetical protein